MIQDIRYGLRMLTRNPGFTAAAILMLALGIGANTAVFSLVNALFFKLLPVEDPQQLVSISQWRGRQPVISEAARASFANYLDYRDRSTVFFGVAAHSSAWFWLTSGTEPAELSGAVVSGNYFTVLGVRPRLGRVIQPEEDSAPGRHPVVVLSYRTWQAKFHADPQILGRVIRLNRVSFTVIGVAPDGFTGIYVGRPEELWIPLTMATAMPEIGNFAEKLFGREDAWLQMFGRLRPGRTIEEARAEFSTLARQLETAYPDVNKDLVTYLARVQGVHPLERSQAATVPVLLGAAAGVMLLIACANLAGLLLARGSARKREIAVRLSLGAARGRIVRQLLTESLLLSLMGGVAGLTVALWSSDLIRSYYQYRYAGVDLRLDPAVLGIAAGLSLLTGLLFGLVPAWQATKPEVVLALKDDSAGSGQRRSVLRAALVIGQIALSLVLLVGAGLLVESLRKVVYMPGLEQDRIAQFRLRPSRLGYKTDKAQAYHRELIRRLQSMPGVQSVVVGSTPPARGWNNVRLSLAGQDPLQVDNNDVTPGFLPVMGIPLLGGRDFDQSDLPGAPLVAVVNQALANRLWPRQDALGRFFSMQGKQYRVIGITPDTYASKNGEGPVPYAYFCYWQRDRVDSRLFAKVHRDAKAMLPVLRREIGAADPDVHIGQEMTLQERTELSYEPERLLSRALEFCGLVALVLSAIGIYGVLALTVTRRTREIGIRMALGARAGDVLRLILGQGISMTLCGVTIGFVAALASTRLLAGFLYGVSYTDPLVFGLVSLLLAGVALLACYVPARRATKVDPMTALRYE